MAVVIPLAGSVMCFRAGAMIDTAEAALQEVQRVGSSPSATLTSGPVSLVVPTSPESWFHPSGRNSGTEAPAIFLANLALRDNAPLVITSGWGRTTGPTTSDHHMSRTDSSAFDLAVPGVGQPSDATATAAARIASALGEPGWTGGNLVRTVDGYRFQLLWLVAGHFDHVHIGVRKVA